VKQNSTQNQKSLFSPPQQKPQQKTTKDNILYQHDNITMIHQPQKKSTMILYHSANINYPTHNNGTINSVMPILSTKLTIKIAIPSSLSFLVILSPLY